MTNLGACREAVYLIPYFCDTSDGIYWCYLEFSGGIGFIGGGIDKNETQLEALYREVKEEVLGVRFNFTGLQEIPGGYDFYNPVRKVNERHTYFMLQLPSKAELKSAESGVKIAWARSDRVLALLQHKEQRQFLAERVRLLNLGD